MPGISFSGDPVFANSLGDIANAFATGPMRQLQAQQTAQDIYMKALERKRLEDQISTGNAAGAATQAVFQGQIAPQPGAPAGADAAAPAHRRTSGAIRRQPRHAGWHCSERTTAGQEQDPMSAAYARDVPHANRSGARQGRSCRTAQAGGTRTDGCDRADAAGLQHTRTRARAGCRHPDRANDTGQHSRSGVGHARQYGKISRRTRTRNCRRSRRLVPCKRPTSLRRRPTTRIRPASSRCPRRSYRRGCKPNWRAMVW